MKKNIYVKGARTHNLKNINLEIPRNKLITITGLSGSGKSSLAFDTIFAEGQRRYMESLSSYARQFLSMMDKGAASIEDILLLFIYLELGAVVGIYFQTNHMPVRFLIYVAITALTRLLLELVFEWHSIEYINIIIVCGGILLLAASILVLRYASHNYPSN